MKTITLNDDQYKFIEEMVTEMKTQSNRATQFPMFMVSEMVGRAVPDGCGESKRKDIDGHGTDGMCAKCLKLDEDGEDLPDYCDECDSDCFWNCETERETIDKAGMFFTAKACDRHIEANDYHYDDPKSYAISCWRNKEMQKIFEILFTIAGIEIPSHYK